MSFDKHIELPTRGKPHVNFRAMEVGDSVFVPHEGGILKCAAYLYAKTIQKRSKRFAFAGRTVTENNVAGVRIWRTA